MTKQSKNPSLSFVFDNHPVVQMSWRDAMVYSEWLTSKLSRVDDMLVITLPTEAQWEKAARGTEGRIYPWGDSPDPGMANYDETGIDSTNPVGCFPYGQSPYGIQDLAGNDLEWCLGWFH